MPSCVLTFVAAVSAVKSEELAGGTPVVDEMDGTAVRVVQSSPADTLDVLGRLVLQ
jgi:hypothetical protein